MKWKLLIAVVGAFLLGIVADRLFLNSSPRVLSPADHWQRVEDYNEYMRNPPPDSANHVSAVAPPFDIEPHLAALVAAGQLEHLDVVLPGTPADRETNKYWMRFVEAHPDIVYAYGIPGHRPTVEAKSPLHLNLWYKHSAQSSVDQLIRELEAIAPGRDAAAGNDQSERKTSSGPNDVVDAGVPRHELRDRFLGQWQEGTDPFVSIVSMPDGPIVVRLPQSPRQYAVGVHHVRWAGNDLTFDQSMTLPFLPGDVKEVNSVITLSLTADPTRLKYSLSVVGTSKTVTGELSRAP